jgi:hypothetical protein
MEIDGVRQARSHGETRQHSAAMHVGGHATKGRASSHARADSWKRPRWHRGDKDVTTSIAHKADLTTVHEKKKEKVTRPRMHMHAPIFLYYYFNHAESKVDMHLVMAIFRTWYIE